MRAHRGFDELVRNRKKRTSGNCLATGVGLVVAFILGITVGLPLSLAWFWLVKCLWSLAF